MYRAFFLMLQSIVLEIKFYLLIHINIQLNVVVSIHSLFEMDLKVLRDYTKQFLRHKLIYMYLSIFR